MRTFFHNLCLSLLLMSGAACEVATAQPSSASILQTAPSLRPSPESSQSSRPEKGVGQRLQAKYPSLQVLSITRLPTGTQPLYEFLASGMVGYTDEGVNFVLLGGNLITGSGSTLLNVTVERAKSSATNLVRGLPVDRALKEVFGKGERILIVFADPDCSFCQAFEKETHEQGDSLNATVYTFLYPMTDLHPDADRKARYLACTANPSQSWKDWMLQPTNWDAFASTHPSVANCPAARNVDTAINIGRSLRMVATPTLLFHNGMTLTRKPTMEELNKALDYVADHPDDVQSLNVTAGAGL